MIILFPLMTLRCGHPRSADFMVLVSLSTENTEVVIKFGKDTRMQISSLVHVVDWLVAVLQEDAGFV